MVLAKTVLTGVIVGAVSLAAPPPAAGLRTGAEMPHAPARATPLQRIVRQLVRHGAPGALAVVRTPRVVRRAASGLARRQPRVDLRATDPFRVASVTKPFVATVVLQLVAEGRLGLDDSVDRWLPGLVPGGDAITIRELLNHTSGLFDYTNDDRLVGTVIADPGHRWSPRELVAAAVSHPALFPSGSGWSYSGTNYILLGLVIEAVTGSTLERQLHERLFSPLGLARTWLPTDARVEGRFAHGYIGRATFPSLGGGLLDVTELLSPSWAWAAGGIVSNGDDITRFLATLLGGRLLPRELLVAMRTRAPGSQYGLGLMRAETRCGPAFGHIGDFTAYRTVAYARPHGRRVAVVMVNVDETHVSWYELRTAAARALCEG